MRSEELKVAAARPAAEKLYDFPVLGKVEVTDRQQMREILTAFRRAIHNPPTGAACFWPRHAIRVVKGGETVDAVICFECHRCMLCRGGERPKDTGRMTEHMSPDPEPLFDKILTDAGVPLAKKSHE
jgi:hypothetical protein